eukprot:CFRG8649
MACFARQTKFEITGLTGSLIVVGSAILGISVLVFFHFSTRMLDIIVSGLGAVLFGLASLAGVLRDDDPKDCELAMYALITNIITILIWILACLIDVVICALAHVEIWVVHHVICSSLLVVIFLLYMCC